METKGILRSAVFFAALLLSLELVSANPLLQLAGPVPVVVGPTYLLEQNFDGTGTPSGWSTQGTVDFDYTTSPAPLEGTQSLYLATASDNTTTAAFSATADVWVHARINTSGNPAANSTIISLRASTVQQAYVQLRTTGAWGIGHGSTTGIGGSFTGGTTYYVWVHYIAGGGADGTLELYYSTTTTKPGSPSLTAITTGTSTGSIDNIRVLGTSASVIADRLLADDATIGDNP